MKPSNFPPILIGFPNVVVQQIGPTSNSDPWTVEIGGGSFQFDSSIEDAYRDADETRRIDATLEIRRIVEEWLINPQSRSVRRVITNQEIGLGHIGNAF
jgi:hypothetical protein